MKRGWNRGCNKSPTFGNEFRGGLELVGRGIGWDIIAEEGVESANSSCCKIEGKVRVFRWMFEIEVEIFCCEDVVETDQLSYCWVIKAQCQSRD